MKDETLKDLRAKAKARGLKGYSKLSKEDLIRELSKAPPKEAASPTKKPAARVKAAGKKKAATPATAASKRASPVIASEKAPVTPEVATDSTEQKVESAKYALRPEGAPTPTTWPDLGEDIDNLPALHEPMVCLLPQKPGILHAYWHLPARSDAREYKLRLYRMGEKGMQVYQEINASQGRGNHYFHVPESVHEQEMAAQLGYYEGNTFVVAQGRSIARLPSLYASSRTDHRWWISEKEFAEMYLRAGGVARASRYGWSASTSSAGGAPSSRSAEQMYWPGGVSSSR